MDIHVKLRQRDDGGWQASADTRPPIEAVGQTRDRCVAAIRRAVKASLGPRRSFRDVTFVIEALPQLAGVAEAAEVMGWDKRRVVTYIDRGSFPAPVQALASGRIWVRTDVEEFARAWRDRQAARTKRG